MTPDSAGPTHRSLRDTGPLDYSALVLPGGVASADELRTMWAAATFAERIFEMGKPTTVICHAPWRAGTKARRRCAVHHEHIR